MTPAELQQLTSHLNFENFKKNETVNGQRKTRAGMLKSDQGDFVRKGKINGWQGHFSKEIDTEVDKWIKENLKLTDIKFPV